MAKKILIIHTREICYYSGAFFLHRMEEALQRAGAEVDFVELSDEAADWNLLGDLLDRAKASPDRLYDAVLDINSKLPYLTMEGEDGREVRFLNELGIPFYNWIVDHPLYHHPGIVLPVWDQHVLTIDRSHAAYVEKYYAKGGQVPQKGSTSVDKLPATYFPVPGQVAQCQIPFAERSMDLLFPGTYLPREKYMAEIENVAMILDAMMEPGHTPTFQDLRDQLYQTYVPEEMALEDALTTVLQKQGWSTADFAGLTFPQLMNYLYPLDRRVRYEKRLAIAEAAAMACQEVGWTMTIRGEGWEETSLSDMANVNLLPGVDISLIYETIADARVLLDVNPLFHCGMHDRVPSAMANQTLVLTNMSQEAEPELNENCGVFYYRDACDVGDCIRKLANELRDREFVAGAEGVEGDLSQTEAQGRQNSLQGNSLQDVLDREASIFRENYSWDVAAGRFLRMLDSER